MNILEANATYLTACFATIRFCPVTLRKAVQSMDSSYHVFSLNGTASRLIQMQQIEKCAITHQHLYRTDQLDKRLLDLILLSWKIKHRLLPVPAIDHILHHYE
jgi:hypothetical protein